MLAGSLAYLSFCVNPLIYASRYEVFRRYLKKMLGRDGFSQAGSSGHGTATATQSSRPTVIA